MLKALVLTVVTFAAVGTTQATPPKLEKEALDFTGQGKVTRTMVSNARFLHQAFLCIGTLVACALLLVACGKPETAPPPPEVKVIKVEPRDTPVTFEFVGNTVSSQQVEVRARVDGFLNERLYVEGSIVKVDQVMFQTDPCLETFGYEAGEVEGRAVWNLFVPDEDRQQVQAVFANLVAERMPSFHENEWMARNGARRLIAWSNTTLADADGKLRYVIATGVDITAKHAAERSLREANRALRTLSACNEILVRETDELVLLQKICAAIVEVGEFAAAWVGYARDESPLTVQLVTQAGLVADTGRDDCTAGTLCPACPARAALQTARPIIDNAIDPQACSSPWMQGDSIQAGGSLVALPLMQHDQPLGVLVIFARESNAFGSEEVALLSDLADDLVYGIRSLRTERERIGLLEAQQQSNAQLQQTLVKTIESLAVALEKRDPYTSGHQQRVADLAVAIAKALQLDAERVEGIRLGALIHDVGKIYVPSEILNRPGRLTAAEFALIKTHSDVGFEIVQRVEFPWPVAQMIRQHHERLDGSGYPDGLAGDAIILEARVLAVADVVEAMTSHRPYRPGLGIDAALEEISLHRGTRYDPKVVDICLQVFRDRDFAFATSTTG